MSNLIRHKGIFRDRMDAPFVGTLISSIDCHHNCPGCFHQAMRDMPYEEDTVEDIIKEIKEDPFSEGVIFGGLEWTEQYGELLELIHACLDADLKVIVYTHHTEEEVYQRFSNLMDLPIYIKFGEYQEEHKVLNYTSHGVPLETSNQYIKYFG